jgi:hypothetical protein
MATVAKTEKVDEILIVFLLNYWAASTDLGPRTGLPNKILKGDHQRIILAKLESMIGPVV